MGMDDLLGLRKMGSFFFLIWIWNHVAWPLVNMRALTLLCRKDTLPLLGNLSSSVNDGVGNFLSNQRQDSWQIFKILI
jgi:hypothetical protein